MEPAMEEEAEEDGDRISFSTLAIDRVTRVSVGSHRWFPEVQEVDGRSFVTLSRFDAGLCLAVTGKALNRHTVRSLNGLNLQWWEDARSASNSQPASVSTCLWMELPFLCLVKTEQYCGNMIGAYMAPLLGHLACTNALHHHMTAALADGEKKPKFRKVRDDDKFIICRSLNVELPAFTAADGTEIDGIQCRMLWALKAKDLHVELSEENLRYCFAALANSEPIEKKSKKPRDEDGAEPAQCSSPRKRRRLKRRLSQEQGERAASADVVEEEAKSPLHDRAQ